MNNNIFGSIYDAVMHNDGIVGVQNFDPLQRHIHNRIQNFEPPYNHRKKINTKKQSHGLLVQLCADLKLV